MREIKFRAWNIKEKIMAEVGDLNWSGKVNVTYKKGEEKPGYFFGGNNVSDDWGKEDHVLMQYTGLEDRNYKEIYEGEIIFNEDRQEHSIVKWHEGKAMFVVEYVETKDSFPLWESLSNLYYSVGNIYENSELLNK